MIFIFNNIIKIMANIRSRSMPRGAAPGSRPGAFIRSTFPCPSRERKKNTATRLCRMAVSVLFYCRDLNRLLTGTAPSRALRSAQPRSHAHRRPCGRSRGCWWLPVPPGNTRRSVHIRPGGHVVQQVVRGLRQALEHAVDQRHRLCAGDLRIRTEGAVLIAVDPAQRRRALNLRFRPMAEISVKLLSLSRALSSNRAQITANSARVMLASGRNDPSG